MVNSKTAEENTNSIHISILQIIGWLFIGLGILFFILNIGALYKAEYITHQTYYMIEMAVCVLLMIFGALLNLMGKK